MPFHRSLAQLTAPLVEADQDTNALTASAAAGVPGAAETLTPADGTAETAGEVMRAALAAEATEIEDLRQKVFTCFRTNSNDCFGAIMGPVSISMRPCSP